MIKLIVGTKGSGKTKAMIDMITVTVSADEAALPHDVKKYL